MSKNEKLLVAALQVAISEVNHMAEGGAQGNLEWASIDLLDRLEAGFRSGDIQLKAKSHMFSDDRLCWPPMKPIRGA